MKIGSLGLAVFLVCALAGCAATSPAVVTTEAASSGASKEKWDRQPDVAVAGSESGRVETLDSPRAPAPVAGSGRTEVTKATAGERSLTEGHTVKLLVTVNEEGIPVSVVVHESSGNSRLDETARSTVSRKWRWPPGSRRKFMIPMTFKLEPAGKE